MQQIVSRFAEALKWIDESGKQYRNYQPGVGPFGEPQVAKQLLEYLRRVHPKEFKGAKTKRDPDVLIPGQWAIELKIVRPFGDNGVLAEHWSENLLHPYEGNVSSLGDCLKLVQSEFKERLGVVVLTYEHSPPRIDLAVLMDSFELVARQILALKLGPRCSAVATNLVHPVHQQAVVYGWELQQ